MPRYIDLDNADVEQISCFYGSECRLADVQEWLDSLPVVTIPTGTWKYYSSTMMECSNCSRHTAYHRYEFCPHCGARMQREV